MPHLQASALYPEILAETREGNLIVLELGVDESLAYFPGHFPGTPILPGVVQVHWAVHLARSRFQLVGAFHHMEVVKFKDLILPGMPLQLHLDYDGKARRLKFAYRSHEREHSSGRIYFHGD